MASTTSANQPENNFPRDALIDTAVRFLTNPNVVDRPIQQKQSFLKSKGMTDEEIRISFEKANIHAPISHQSQDTVIPMYNVSQPVATQQLSLWMRIRDFLHTLTLLGGLGYLMFWVYKSYIEPFLFGRPKPKKSTAESLSSIEEAVNQVNRSTNELRAEFRTELARLTQERDSSATRNLTDIKTDISTVKGILLSRQQFPSAPLTSSLRTGQSGKPSIPSWQLSSDLKSGSKSEEEQSSDMASTASPSLKSSESVCSTLQSDFKSSQPKPEAHQESASGAANTKEPNPNSSNGTVTNDNDGDNDT